MTQLVTMYDTIGADAAHIPPSAVKVGGYVTGTGIAWPPSAWERFSHAGRVRIDQSPAGEAYLIKMTGTGGGKTYRTGADVYDMEDLAGTVARFGVLAPPRVAAGAGNCGYGTRSTAAAAAAELDSKGSKGWWHGHVDWWLADPNLDLAEASALVGTFLFGFRVRAVQWATPTTNPDTSVPGGTLKSLNLDLSVADAAWFPAPAPPAAPWQAQALRMARELEQSAQGLRAFLGAHQ